MRQLTIQAVSWCWRHGHPVATLAANDGGAPLTLALHADDAEALAPLMRTARDPRAGAGARSRTYELLDDMVAVLGGRLLGVLLHADATGMPEAALSLESPFGVHTVPAHVVDALVLAWRHDLPLLVDARTLDDLRLAGLAHDGEPLLDVAAGTRSGVAQPLPETVRRFIDSLDLRGLGE